TFGILPKASSSENQTTLPSSSSLRCRNSAGWKRRRPSQGGCLLPALYDPLTETFVFSCQQLLRQIVAGAVSIARGAGEMMIDSHFGGATEIPRNRKDFIGRLTGVDLVLCEGTRRANREKFRRDPNETRKQQLLAIEF